MMVSIPMAGMNASGLVPTTKRIWPRAQARGGTALTGLSGTPDVIARISNVHQAKTFSASVSPGSAQFGSITGSPGPDFTSQSASACFTDSGIPAAGTHSGMRICPVGPVMVESAWTS